MSNYKLIIPYTEFVTIINKQIKEGESLLEINIEVEIQLTELKDLFKAWENYTFFKIKDSFESDTNELIESFKLEDPSLRVFRISNSEPSFLEKSETLRSKIKSKISALKNIVVLSKISDIMTYPEVGNYEYRNSFKIKEKEFLLLNKISILNSGSYIHLIPIFESNGIICNYKEEYTEYIDDLVENGYLETPPTPTKIYAKITLKGKKFVEENGNVLPEAEERIDGNGYSKLCSKINEVLSKLDKAEVEREILFNELEELKALYLKLNKKNFKQIVIGKLGDLALSKIIEPSTLKEIYENLIGGNFPNLISN